MATVTSTFTATNGTQSKTLVHQFDVQAAQGIQRIASGYKPNTSGSFDRSASIPDIGPIPAGALIVVKTCGFDTLSITDTAKNTYTKGTDGTSGFRAPTLEYHCLAAADSATNAFDFTISNGGGGVDHYLIAVEAYTGPGTWAYLAAQSGVTQLNYSTANTVNSNPITTSAAGVASGIVQNDNAQGAFAAFSPGEVIIHTPTAPSSVQPDAVSGEYVFTAPLSGQVIAAGVGVAGDYKYLDFNLSVFTCS